VLCSVLNAELNSGYEEIAEHLIVVADGERVRSLRHLVEIVESREEGLLVLQTPEKKRIVLDRERVRREGPELRARYQVPSDRSEDLLVLGGTRTVDASAGAHP